MSQFWSSGVGRDAQGVALGVFDVDTVAIQQPEHLLRLGGKVPEGGGELRLKGRPPRIPLAPPAMPVINLGGWQGLR
jgi:hypothetical protein